MHTRVTLIADLEQYLQKFNVHISEEMSDEEAMTAFKEEKAAKDAALTELFGVDARGCSSVLTLYADSWEHSRELYSNLFAMGYKNIRTYVPLVCDGTGGSCPDPNPKHQFAVEAYSTHLYVHSKLSKQLLKIVEQLPGSQLWEYATKVRVDAYDRLVSISFNSMERADSYLKLLTLEVEKLIEVAEARAMASPLRTKDLSVKEEFLDVFTVNMKLYQDPKHGFNQNP
ncbi:hypothetical protein L1D14_10510 [Vibrio tubiashii]|uniref:hypothetical protein n=1 Tax=Vibrio tubiashii TaxID=29498 RepID=UPI001EFD6385|nr:hypothetical protein [Vibrio tubiashii]MCG9576669.1 hypothetical protein [Vibrio tubiashii]